MQEQTSEQFIIAAIKIGQSYLIHGGGISHLESCILSAGTVRGFSTSVHATPVSLTITTINNNSGYSKSLSSRITQGAPHLAKLVFAERLLAIFSRGSLRSKRLIFLVEKIPTIQSYNPPIEILALFLVGFCASYKMSLRFDCAIFGGLLTLLSCFTCRALSKYLQIHDNLKDFFNCFFAISISIPLSGFLHLHPSQLFIGSLALVLPGLTLTSAVGDLIEDHFQTGLVKIAKSMHALLSMGFAYILAVEWTQKFGFVSPPMIISRVDTVPIYFSNLFSTMGMILSFCILLKVPNRAVLACLMIGSGGWTIFSLTASTAHPFAASFLSAFWIALLARVCANFQRMVVQVYIVPSILILVPGLLAFSYLQPLIDDATLHKATQSVLTSLMIAVSLSFGLLLGQIKFTSKQKKLSNAILTRFFRKLW